MMQPSAEEGMDRRVSDILAALVFLESHEFPPPIHLYGQSEGPLKSLYLLPHQSYHAYLEAYTYCIYIYLIPIYICIPIVCVDLFALRGAWAVLQLLAAPQMGGLKAREALWAKSRLCPDLHQMMNKYEQIIIYMYVLYMRI